jgi:DNA primase
MRYLSERGLEYKVRPSGIWILCPFHKETRASLVISKEGLWHCFGCSLSGRFERFVALLEGISVGEARKRLSGWRVSAGWDLRRDERKRDESDVDFLRRIYEEFCVVDYVPGCLQDRGLTVDDFRRFGLRICLNNVYVKGVNLFGWLVAPCFDWDGVFRGLFMRKVSRKDKIFLNTVSGMFWREDLVRRNEGLVLVEGIFDAIFLMKKGINALALLGKNVTDLQMRRFLELKWERPVFVFLDPDALFDAERLCSRLRLLGIKAFNIRARTDPDELLDDEVLQLKDIVMRLEDGGGDGQYEFGIGGYRE